MDANNAKHNRPSEEALNKEEEEEDDDKEGEEEDEGGQEEITELWDVVQVIPTEEEKVQCRNDGCTNQAVATWSSNIDPEDKWDYCKKCQLEEMGGWPDGVNKRQKIEIVVEAGRTTAKLSNEYNFEDNDNGDDNDIAEDKDEDKVATHYQQAVPQHQFLQLLAQQQQQLSQSANANPLLLPPPITKQQN